jgi:hypothetical protein
MHACPRSCLQSGLTTLALEKVHILLNVLAAAVAVAVPEVMVLTVRIGQREALLQVDARLF